MAAQITKETAAAGADFIRRLIADGVDYDTAVARFKQMLVDEALQQSRGCKAAAGRVLGVTRGYIRTIARRSANGAAADEQR